MTRHKTVVVGMDAADQALLLQGIEEGRLPTLARLRDEGAWGVVGEMPGFGSGAVWPSFFTGVSPASHGRYFYRQVRPGEYEASRFGPRDFKAPSIWDYASAAGRRVAVFDVPKASLSADVNGLHVVDWLVHGPVYKKLTTAPPELADELEAKYGLDPMPQCDQPGGRTPAEHVAMRDLLVERVRTRERQTLEFLEREDWDLFITCFGEPHCVGHQSWHLRDRAHPAHQAATESLASDPVMDVYEAIDASTGRILDALGDDVVVLVASVTGMGANYTGNYVLDEVLRRMEGRTKAVGYDWIGRAKRFAKRILPREIRRKYRRKSREIEERFAHTDRERRTFYTVPHNDIAGAIRVNVAGREPHGRVSPEELPSIHKWLRSELKALRNLDTGGPVVRDVVSTAELCQGEHLEDLPEFFVLWHREAPIERVGSDSVGEVVYLQRGNRTGDHAPESIFFAKGPGVVPGRVDGVSVLDFAPTIARLLELPDGPAEGAPIGEIAGVEDVRERAGA